MSNPTPEERAWIAAPARGVRGLVRLPEMGLLGGIVPEGQMWAAYAAMVPGVKIHIEPRLGDEATAREAVEQHVTVGPLTVMVRDLDSGWGESGEGNVSHLIAQLPGGVIWELARVERVDERWRVFGTGDVKDKLRDAQRTAEIQTFTKPGRVVGRKLGSFVSSLLEEVLDDDAELDVELLARARSALEGF